MQFVQIVIADKSVFSDNRACANHNRAVARTGRSPEKASMIQPATVCDSRPLHSSALIRLAVKGCLSKSKSMRRIKFEALAKV